MKYLMMGMGCVMLCGLCGASPLNPAVRKFNTTLLFYASFDHGAAADLSTGSGTPQDATAKIELKPGIFGQAFLAGEQGIAFAAQDNLDMSKPGGLAVWISPYQWRRDGETHYLNFINVASQNRQLMLARMGNVINQEQIYAHAAVGKEGKSIIASHSRDWQDGEWHLLVLNWRNESIEFSFDGGGLQRADVPDFGKAKGELGWIFAGSKGDANQKYLIDELMIFDRPLDADKIAWIWRQRERESN